MSNNVIKPKKWTEVYPAGTKEGDEEIRFFRVLVRNPDHDWRSTSALAKQSNLTQKRVEEIINKYYKMGLIFQNPKNEDMWGYWERVPHMLPELKGSVVKTDQDKRVAKITKKA